MSERRINLDTGKIEQNDTTIFEAIFGIEIWNSVDFDDD